MLVILVAWWVWLSLDEDDGSLTAGVTSGLGFRGWKVPKKRWENMRRSKE
jgi:hypothetical protein